MKRIITIIVLAVFSVLTIQLLKTPSVQEVQQEVQVDRKPVLREKVRDQVVLQVQPEESVKAVPQQVKPTAVEITSNPVAPQDVQVRLQRLKKLSLEELRAHIAEKQQEIDDNHLITMANEGTLSEDDRQRLAELMQEVSGAQLVLLDKEVAQLLVAMDSRPEVEND